MKRPQSGWRLSTIVATVAVSLAMAGTAWGEAPRTTPRQTEPGTLVIGAEQEPDCVDWIASCSGASWGFWMMNVTTMPRSFDIVRDGDEYGYEPSAILKGEPELETEPDQVVTYEISDDAVWSDGRPITSADFEYTWDQIKNGEDIYDRTGYELIEKVDASDPKVAVVTFKKPFASWKGLFGGQYGILPAHILEGKDRSAEMKDGYAWSGGPWKIEKWEKGVEAVLIPNEGYFGPKPKLSKVTFKFLTETSAEFQAFKSGQVSAIYPQPQPDTVEQIKDGVEDAESEFTANTPNLEALWLNNAKAPFNSKAVRRALAYALDRDALVKRLFGPLDVDKASQSFDPPILEQYTKASFKKYDKDLDKVADLLEDDGWKKGKGGIYTKKGKKLSFTLKTTEGNARRELTAEILQQQLKKAGFDMKVKLVEAGDLFGEQLPEGDYQAALYAQVSTTLDPNNCTLFCSKNIPSKDNDFSGQNWTRTEIKSANKPLQDVDTNLDEKARIKSNRKAMDLLASSATSLPLDPLPNIFLWTDKLEGPQDNGLEGPFWNLHEWELKG